jgi:hypothetical protein
LALATACAPPPELPPVQPYDAATLAAIRYKVVLVAGDSSLPVFDNAVDGVAARLRERDGVAQGDFQRLSAATGVVAQEGVRSASLDHVLAAVKRMGPGPGQGCFVFATSHGAAHRGLLLTAMGSEVLSPEALDRALAQGCGNAPTVVVVSGCFTGAFAQPPMARANRVVLTAARADRASFGCRAGRTYAVYDRCLLDALDAGGAWPQVYAAVQRCVGDAERRGQFVPSEPQAWFGPAVADLRSLATGR